MQILAHNGNCL